MIDLTIVILNYNTKDLTLSCLRSIFGFKWNNTIQVIIVDNASIDNTVEVVKKEFSQVKIIENKENLGFTAGNNQALKQIKSQYVLILNSDTELKENSLDNLLDFAKIKGFDISSCKLLDSKGIIQPNVGELPTIGMVFCWLSGLDDILRGLIFLPSYHQSSKNYYLKNHEVGWVTGAAMLISKEVLEKIGLFDDNIFMYTEDVEFCYRAKKAGFKVGYTSSSEIIHLGGASSKNPKYTQWLGEFKGLIYLYKKYKSNFNIFFLKMLIYIFILIRIIVFTIIGKLDYSVTYLKVLKNL